MRLSILTGAAGLIMIGGIGIACEDDAAMASRGRAALRAMDCARCHGRDYDGWAAPSLLVSVRNGPRERFERIVLEGDIVRGMPGYLHQPRVVADLDAIYVYLRTRSTEGLGSSGREPAPRAESACER